MSGEAVTTTLIEKGIERRANGRYTARTRRGTLTVRRTFATLREAREFRDFNKKNKRKRKGRRVDMNISGAAKIAHTGFVSDDVHEARTERRQALASAPRTKTVIDGRTFTVVHLPPTAGGVA